MLDRSNLKIVQLLANNLTTNFHDREILRYFRVKDEELEPGQIVEVLIIDPLGKAGKPVWKFAVVGDPIHFKPRKGVKYLPLTDYSHYKVVTAFKTWEDALKWKRANRDND